MVEEARGGYEAWLDGIAGRRVATGPLFCVWVLLLASASAVAFLVGAREESTYSWIVALASPPYWFVGVPWWLRRRNGSSQRDQ